MYYSENHCSASSVSSAEVFRKEDLEINKSMDEKRGKQKRRDRVLKSKSSSKTKHSKSSGDVLAQIKAKENIVAPNNGQRITISRECAPSLFSQKLGIYNKGKSSLMVSRRRPLHDIQMSQKTMRETEKDLKRVLGYGGSQNSPVKGSPRVVGWRNSPVTDSDGQTVEPNKQSSSEMEMSPPADQQQATSADSDTILSIARRIAEGLHPRMVYSDTDYLNNVKSELRKLLKQGSGGADMDTLVADGLTDSPSTNTGVSVPPSGTSSFFSVPLFDDQGKIDQPDHDTELDVLPPTFFETSSAPSHIETGPPFNLTEVELTTSAFDPSYPPPPTSISVDGVCASYFQMEPPPSPPVDPPRDFLDLLDTMQQGGLGDHSTRPPGAKWMPTPERPPMFPQKLY